MEGRGTHSKTLADLLVRSAEQYGSRPAVRYNEGGTWVDRSFQQVLDIAKPLALGLVALGVEKGDRVSILGNTRPEWTYFDWAALSIGATVVPIYHGRIDRTLFECSLRSLQSGSSRHTASRATR